MQLSNQKDLFQLELNQDLEKHKSELKIITFKFFELHKKRMNVLSTLYEKLSELQLLMIELTAIFKISTPDFETRENEKIIRTANLFNDFITYFTKNEIFLEQETCDSIEELRKIYYEVLGDYDFARRLSSDRGFAHQLLTKSNATVRNNAQEILSSIKVEFRKVMDI